MSLFDVAVDKASMSRLSDKIYIRDIVEEPYEEDVYKANKAYFPGQRVSKTVRRSLSVRVVFVVRERNPEKRADILDKIIRWATGGNTLEVSYRTKTITTPDGYTYMEGRRLSRVVLTAPPALDSANKWTQDLSMTFTAFDVPYWEDQARYGYGFNADTLNMFNRYYWSRNISNDGTAPTPVELEIENTSQTALMSLFLRVADTRFSFENLNIDAGYKLYIKYDEQTGLLQIYSDKGSAYLMSRTADSNDELIANPGDNVVQVEANVPTRGTVYIRGRYL